MHIKEKLPNGWIFLQYREECTVCEKERITGKVLFDSFICSNCVERLGAAE
jgi:hypothetical protein